MARAALQWTVRDLAGRSGVAVATVNRFERERAQPHPASREAIRLALEAAGVRFPADGCVCAPGAAEPAQH